VCAAANEDAVFTAGNLTVGPTTGLYGQSNAATVGALDLTVTR